MNTTETTLDDIANAIADLRTLFNEEFSKTHSLLRADFDKIHVEIREIHLDAEGSRKTKVERLLLENQEVISK